MGDRVMDGREWANGPDGGLGRRSRLWMTFKSGVRILALPLFLLTSPSSQFPLAISYTFPSPLLNLISPPRGTRRGSSKEGIFFVI